MAEKLDFSLPQKKPRGSVAGVLTVLLLLVLVALAAANLSVALKGSPSDSTAKASGLSAEQVRQLATKLAQRELSAPAAAAWQDYLAGAELTDAARARALFHAADALERAGRYADAIE